MHTYAGTTSDSIVVAQAISLRILPPGPKHTIASGRSPSRELSYWYLPHTAPDDLPVLFLHGIGVGLYPYMEFLKELNQGRQEGEGQIGILAIEFLSISSRLTSPMLPKKELCRQLQTILDRHGFHRFVLVSHSQVAFSSWCGLG